MLAHPSPCKLISSLTRPNLRLRLRFDCELIRQIRRSSIIKIINITQHKLLFTLENGYISETHKCQQEKHA